MNTRSDPRAEQLHTWINSFFDVVDDSFSSVSGDASFRRYFRFTAKNELGLDEVSLIAVDAPPEHENIQPFIDIALLLADHNLPAPRIYLASEEEGFYVQQDLGDQLLLGCLNNDNAEQYYKTAMNQIIVLQRVPASHLPKYDSALLQKEMALFSDWYLGKHLCKKLTDDDNKQLAATFNTLEKNALEQAQVFVHRDYHSRNLMLLEDEQLGIIDFQDAVFGPVTYDLVSLLRDCYISWPQNDIDHWVSYFHQQLECDCSLSQFVRWFDLMGVQRHLKATGIFCRLNYRDGKSVYLNDIPRTLSYIKEVSHKYPELNYLNQLVSSL